MKYLLIAAGIFFSSSLLAMDRDIKYWKERVAVWTVRIDVLEKCKQKKADRMLNPKHTCDLCKKYKLTKAQEELNWFLANDPKKVIGKIEN